MNSRPFQLRLQTIRHKKIIDTPPSVFLPRFKSIRPPAVNTGCIGIKIAEAVCKTGFQQGCHFAAFLIGKPGIFPVCFRIFQVNFLMCHIKVTTNDNRFLFIQFQQIAAEIILPLHAIIQTGQPILRVWRINRYQIKVFQLQCNHTPLMIVLLLRQTVRHTQRLLFTENSRSRVAFFLRTVPVLVITRQIQFQLPSLHFCFLQTEKICIHFMEKIHKSFSHTGPQAVYIPGYQFHINIVSLFLIRL